MKTAEEILENEWDKNKNNCPFNEIYVGEKVAINNAMIEFAKMHVQEALKQDSEKAYAQGKGSTLTTKRSNFYYTYAGHIGKIEMNKESILNAYPLDSIK